MPPTSKSTLAVAQRLGLRLIEEAGAAEQFRRLPEVTSSARIRPVLLGELDGRVLAVAQSSYMVYTGQSMAQVAHTIYAIEAPGWPTTHVTPRGLLGRLAVLLGRDPSPALENPQFNLRFKVKSDDEDFAITLLSPEMQVFMLTKTGVRWRIYPGQVCLVYSGTLKPQRVEASLQRLRDFWLRVPGELLRW